MEAVVVAVAAVTSTTSKTPSQKKRVMVAAGSVCATRTVKLWKLWLPSKWARMQLRDSSLKHTQKIKERGEVCGGRCTASA